MNEDFEDFLNALARHGARFMVVGAHALAVHGAVRATEDLDVWIERTDENASKVFLAMVDFGAPIDALGVTPAVLVSPETVVQIGVPPRRIDVLTSISGLEFLMAWPDRVMQRIGDRDIAFIGRASLVANKRAAGRYKDLADLERLGEA